MNDTASALVSLGTGCTKSPPPPNPTATEITPGTRTAKRTGKGKRKGLPELLSQSHTSSSPQKVNTVVAAKAAKIETLLSWMEPE